MPIFYIPTIGEKIKLVQDWTFTLYDEYRNESMINALGLGHDYWSRSPNLGETMPAEVTLPAGTVLTVSRIYVRSGLKDYDSVTFIVNKKGCPDPRIANNKTGKQIRFWVKLNDNDKVYYWYDKLATENDTGMPCACYKYANGIIDARIWLYCDGRITED